MKEHEPLRWDLTDLMSVAEVAAHLRVSRSTVYRAIEAGALGTFRIGEDGIYRISGFHLRRFLEAGLSEDLDHYAEELAARGSVPAEEMER